jgi:signal transduction histidine kinase
MTSTWAAAIAAASQHDGARRLGEQLADANRRVVQAQTSLADVESMLRLGELAAGLAHEMNNPLTVVRGRCQMLARGAKDDAEREAAQAVADAAERLSDLVTSLHFFARPPEAKPDVVDLPDLLARVVRDFKLARTGGGAGSAGVRLVVQGPIPPVWVDPGHLGSILKELLQNAWEARPAGFIEVRAHIDGADDRLILTVRDDGAGMSEHALKHAFDPFFSEKAAGRQTGLGLARARRLADLIAGRIELSSRIGEGTTARVVLERWRREGASMAA